MALSTQVCMCECKHVFGRGPGGGVQCLRLRPTGVVGAGIPVREDRATVTSQDARTGGRVAEGV